MKREDVSQAQEKIAVSAEYLRGLEEKAEAYDMLMSGGMKTPKEVANFLGLPIAESITGHWSWFISIPYLEDNHYRCDGINGFLPDLIDYTGDWKDSLTLPDGWEEERMIAEHEHGMNMYDANGMP